MAQPALEENTEQIQSMGISEFPVLDATYGLLIETATKDMEKIKKGVSENECRYLLEENLIFLDAEIKSLEREKEDGLYGDFENNPKFKLIIVGIENSLRGLYAQYLDEANKRGLSSLISEVERLSKERENYQKKFDLKPHIRLEESVEKIEPFDGSKFPILDMTYGTVIKNAKEGMEKIKEGAKKSSYLLEYNSFWLEVGIKHLEMEKANAFYGDLINDPKIVGIENSLRELYNQYVDESKKRNLTFNLSCLNLNPKNK